MALAASAGVMIYISFAEIFTVKVCVRFADSACFRFSIVAPTLFPLMQRPDGAGCRGV